MKHGTYKVTNEKKKKKKKKKLKKKKKKKTILSFINKKFKLLINYK